MPRRSRLLRATTALYLAVVALITLTPQPRPTDNGLLRSIAEVLARWPATAWIDIDAVEFVANIALFVPLGVLGILLFGRQRWWLVLLAGVVLTGGIEAAQFGIPNRVPDVRDLLANTLGTALGVTLAFLPRRARVR